MAQDAAHYARNTDYIFRKIVDELVLVPVHRDVSNMDCIYVLNSVGAFIWQKLESPVTRAALQAALEAEYAAGAATIAADLDAYLQQMTAIGAVREV